MKKSTFELLVWFIGLVAVNSYACEPVRLLWDSCWYPCFVMRFPSGSTSLVATTSAVKTISCYTKKLLHKRLRRRRLRADGLRPDSSSPSNEAHLTPTTTPVGEVDGGDRVELKN